MLNFNHISFPYVHEDMATDMATELGKAMYIDH